MPLQYFLQEGVEGSENLKKLYKDLNNEFFSGSLPSIPVKWSGKLKRAIGQAACKYKRNSLRAGKSTRFEKYLKEIPIADVQINMSSLGIKLSTAFDLQLPDVKAVMLHEMVHIKLYTQKKLGGHHDTPEFDGYIRKLKEQSGLNVPHKESEFKKSPKLQAKEGYLILLILTDGTFGITSYSKNFLMKEWLLFSKRMTEIPSLSSKIQRLYGYRISHPIVGTMTGKRSIKGISWSTIDEETAEEIKKGKLFLSADKEGGTFIPKVLGIRDDEFDLSGELQFKKGKLITEAKGSYLDNKKMPREGQEVYMLAGQMSDKVIKGKIRKITNIDQKGLANTYMDIEANGKNHHINIAQIYDHKPKRVKTRDEYGEVTIWERYKNV